MRHGSITVFILPGKTKTAFTDSSEKPFFGGMVRGSNATSSTPQ